MQGLDAQDRIEAIPFNGYTSIIIGYPAWIDELTSLVHNMTEDVEWCFLRSARQNPTTPNSTALHNIAKQGLKDCARMYTGTDSISQLARCFSAHAARRIPWKVTPDSTCVVLMKRLMAVYCVTILDPNFKAFTHATTAVSRIAHAALGNAYVYKEREKTDAISILEEDDKCV
jgi:hypothetical protein